MLSRNENYLQEIIASFSNAYSPVHQRIQYFQFVRNIPYSVGYQQPQEVVFNGTGDCLGKSRLLAELFATLGISARFLIAKYRLPPFPEEVRYIPGQCDYHHAAEFLLDGQWVLVDPTYDPPLAKLGFIVNNWNGITPVPLCVQTLSIKRDNEDNPYFDREKANFDKHLMAVYEEHESELLSYTRKYNQILSKARVT